MAVYNHTIDKDNLEEAEFGIVPAGEYSVIIEDSDFQPSKSGSGHTMSLTYQIIEGNFAGRKVFEHLVRGNKSDKANAISETKINAIMFAVGLEKMVDTNELHNIPFRAKVGVKKGNADYPNDKNTILKNIKNGTASSPRLQQEEKQAENTPDIPSAEGETPVPAWRK